jgi:hypothetical protein
MPARGIYIQLAPKCRDLPALTGGVVRDAMARRNARTQTLVQGVQRKAPQPLQTAEAHDHEGDHPSWPQPS